MNTYADKTTVPLALEYLRRVLSQGKALAQFLLQTVPLTEENISVVSMVHLTPAEAREFDLGHSPLAEEFSRDVVIGDDTYDAFPTPSATEWLADEIYELSRRKGSMCIIENSLAEPNDPWLQRATSRIATLGRDVFHLIRNGDERSIIEQSIRESQSIPIFIGALGNPSSNLGIDSSTGTISTGQLAEFSKTAYAIFVGAFDGEGYVLWTAGGA